MYMCFVKINSTIGLKCEKNDHFCGFSKEQILILQKESEIKNVEDVMIFLATGFCQIVSRENFEF